MMVMIIIPLLYLFTIMMEVKRIMLIGIISIMEVLRFNNVDEKRKMYRFRLITTGITNI